MPKLERDGLAEGSVGCGDRAVRTYRRPLSYEGAVSSSNVADLTERWSYQLGRSTCRDRFPLGWVHPLSTEPGGRCPGMRTEREPTAAFDGLTARATGAIWEVATGSGATRSTDRAGQSGRRWIQSCN